MELLIDVGLLVALIVALGELYKQLDLFDVKYLPAINLVLGVVSGVVYLGGDVKDSVLVGIAIGLSASGVFDMTKVFKKPSK